MLVSAISATDNNNLTYSSVPFYYNKLYETDTSFNSLPPTGTEKDTSKEKLPQLFNNINEWQNFCHCRILGKKLNIIV